MKRCLSFILTLVLTVSLLTACADKHLPDFNTEDVRSVTATNAIYSSYMYVIEGREGIDAMTDFYHALTYSELPAGEEAPDLLMGTLYSIRFMGEDQTIADVYISPEGYLAFGGSFEPVYKLTGGFDEQQLQSLLEKYNIFK